MTFVRLHKPSIAYRADASEFSHGAMTPHRICLHDTESGSVKGAGHLDDIHAIVRGWASLPFPDRLAAHFIVDAAGNIGQIAKTTNLLYHVGGLNTGTIGIEQVAFASFTHDEWVARKMQLEKVARLIAFLHTRYRIPLEHAHVAGCGEAGSGVITHADVSRVCGESEGHTDPGPEYPFNAVLARAAAIVAHGGWTRL